MLPLDPRVLADLVLLLFKLGSELGLSVARMNVRLLVLPSTCLQPAIPASTETFLRPSAGSSAAFSQSVSRPHDGCGCGWSLRSSALGIAALLSKRRALRLRTRSAAHVAWHFGCSCLGDANAAMEETLDAFLASFRDAARPRHFCHVSAPPQEPLPSRRKEGSNQPLLLDFGEQGSVPPVNLAFGLLFVPAKWVDRGPELLERLKQELRWPLGAPLLALPTESATLQPGDLYLELWALEVLWVPLQNPGKATLRHAHEPDPQQPAARALFMEASSLEAISQESVRIQDTIDENPLLSIQVYGGKVNGSMLSGRRFFGRESGDVGSALLFSESSRGLAITRRAMALLDVCYPFAKKAGVVAQVPAENSAAPPMYLLAGEEELASGSCLVLLLPGALGTALNFCGVRPIGRPLEVFDADVRTGVIRRVQDDSAEATEPGDRRPSLAAAEALKAMVREAKVKESDVWIGLPRVRLRESAKLRVAPGAGEWALYPWGVVSAEGSLVLKDASPRAEGVCHKSIDRIQLFASSPDGEALSQLASAYKLEAAYKKKAWTILLQCLSGNISGIVKAGGSFQHFKEPFATLCFLGGAGPASSMVSGELFDAVVAGKAVLGAPGTSTPLQTEGRTATAVHRQAAALVMLYSSSHMVQKAVGALDTGAD
ncbi:hypothetical protein AK812_SmicGene8925 [Symbiodinium microadriaticum]|uniref:Uncharacterized protein n=1 Tax=Symbiodinium microadriaticum TaxID=2951 RepID=A0A1Q9EJS4_SYMMI|nr:hypothetical protein AK812_SmicGene8925 [Symbiodinium microadriaticum]